MYVIKSGDYLYQEGTLAKRFSRVQIINKTAIALKNYKKKITHTMKKSRLMELAGLSHLIKEAKELDMAKSFLEDKGLEVEAVDSGNDGEEKASKFKGVSNPEADKTAYIWDGGEGDMNYKHDGKEAFYVWIPFNEDIKKEIEEKFPVLDVGGKNGTFYIFTIEKK